MSIVSSRYEAVIGIETHIQLATNSKMFCGCRIPSVNEEPNTMVCPVCMGLPGTMPTVNKRVLELAIRIGLALGCKIAQTTKFDRKNYTYPDLMKGYQISQYDKPICFDGKLQLPTQPIHTVGIERVHMEEDVARMVHINNFSVEGSSTLLDLNRSGVPLVEVVTKPDLRTPEQVAIYIETLQAIVRSLEVSDANMEAGSFRCDANISVRPVGSKVMNPKVEIKNMNRISAVALALEKETERQILHYEQGQAIVSQTRGWDDASNITVPMRSKEKANDYRYFAEPDIPVISISKNWVELIRSQMPELPLARKQRIIQTLGLSDYDASIIVSQRAIADYFDEAVNYLKGAVPKTDILDAAKNVANWLNTEMARIVNQNGFASPLDTKAKPRHFAQLVDMFRKKELTNSTAKHVLGVLVKEGGEPIELVNKLGLSKLSSNEQLTPLVLNSIKNNPKAVSDYLKGKHTAAKFIVGQVMKATNGRADPESVLQLVKQNIEKNNDL